MAGADTIELQTGQKLSGRILGVTDGIFHYMEERSAGISVSATRLLSEIKGFAIINPVLDELRLRTRELERENRLQQEQLDKAVDNLAALTAKLEDLNLKTARLRSALEQINAAPSFLGQATQTMPVNVPRLPTATPLAAPRPAPTSAANVVARNVAAERDRETGLTTVSGRLFNIGQQAARWIKVQVYGLNEDGLTTIQVTAYSSKPILEPGEAADFSANLRPPMGTLGYNVQVEWN